MTTVTFPAAAPATGDGRIISCSDENLAGSTDEESGGEEESRLPVVHGSLNKWTNYLHGWQERYLVLRDGTLSYFKSANELKYGCRGAIRLVNASITPHKYDVCRFDVSLSDSIWYLRASNEDERQRWIDGLDQHRSAVTSAAAMAFAESGYGSENNLRRHNSLISITSAASLSTASASSVKRGLGLKEKLLEMETFKEILNKQVDNLQAYFDSCAAVVQDSVHDLPIEDEADDEDEDVPAAEDDISEEERRAAPSRTGFLSRFLPFGRTQAAGVPIRPENDDTVQPPVTNVPVAHVTFPGTGPTAVRPPAHSPAPLLPSPQQPSSPQPPSQLQHQGVSRQTSLSLLSHGEPSGRVRELQAILRDHGALALDFKGNSYTFKATTTGILANLGHCIELMQQREDYWRRRLERETERRRRTEDAYRALAAAAAAAGANAGSGETLWGPVGPRAALSTQLHTAEGVGKTPSGEAAPKVVVLGGPDLEEGPGCSLGEEEFFDAVDAQLDKMAEAEERADALKRASETLRQAGEEEGSDPVPLGHPLHDEIEDWVQRQYAATDLDLQRLKGWTLLAQDGDMRMYKMTDGVSPDDNAFAERPGGLLAPLKAVHTVNGITAKEVCRYFWDVRYRPEWESSLDQAPQVLELPGRQTAVIHQVHRRVWPATQRDVCFWSHLRRVVDQEGGEFWMVVNRSTDHMAPKLDTSKMLRLWLNVAMVCQTVLTTPRMPCVPLQRDQVRCKVQYTATLDPGGWVPKGAAKAIYEREYPKFLKRFTGYVYERCKAEPVDL